MVPTQLELVMAALDRHGVKYVLIDDADDIAA